MIPIDFAPMEGITVQVFRSIHKECFDGIHEYYMPFISPTIHLCLNGKEKRDVLPQNNIGVPCVPQVLTREAEHFLWAARTFEQMGYRSINLNAGCPSGTVTAKGKGAGILKDPDALERFLDAICKESPLPISIKTRIGWESPEEWPHLLSVYARYPLQKLIIHPRTCREGYLPGTMHMECLDEAFDTYPGSLVINGDINTPEDAEKLIARYPRAAGLMCGRGLTANPALARELHGGDMLKKQEVIHFHDRLLQEYQNNYQPDIVMMKLRVVMKHLSCAFDAPAKYDKQIRKARSLGELIDKDHQLFDDCELKERPAFVHDMLK